MSIYLDYNASAPISPDVLECMIDVYRNYTGNADSRTHNYGENARNLVETARGQAASLFGVKKDEIFFTSGATESSNLAILGLQKYGLETGRKHLIVTAIEHKAVLEAAKHLGAEGFEIEIVNPGQDGCVSADDILSKVRKDTLLVSVMHVNNETGVIQPVDEIGEALAKTDVLFHIDATQSAGKLVPEIQRLSYCMMSFSGHKMHGPQGVGGLILRKKQYRLPPVRPIMFGGAQEHGIRPGTLPTALIAGLGKACELAQQNYSDHQLQNAAIKLKLLKLLEESDVAYAINGNPNHCIPSTLNVSFFGVSSEALMLATRQHCGIANGSACTSSIYQNSHVLSAMGLPDERIESAVRISWDADVDAEEFLCSFSQILNAVRDFTA